MSEERKVRLDIIDDWHPGRSGQKRNQDSDLSHLQAVDGPLGRRNRPA